MANYMPLRGKPPSRWRNASAFLNKEKRGRPEGQTRNTTKKSRIPLGEAEPEGRPRAGVRRSRRFFSCH